MPLPFEFVAFTEVSAARPLYERDIMNAICLPDAARMSLTYRKKWIDDGAWEACSSMAKPAPLMRLRSRGARARILLVLYERNAAANRRYLPLRFATLESVEIHDHLSSTFAAPDKVEPGVTLFVALADRPSERLIGELSDVLEHSQAVRRDEALKKYLVGIPNPIETLEPFADLLSGSANWQRHVGMMIDRSESLKQDRHWAIFSPFRPVRGLNGGKPIKPRRRSASNATTFPLLGGSSYEIDCHVHETSVGTFSEAPITASVVGAHVEVSPAGVSQFGGGALVNFLVATQRKFSPEIVGVNFLVLAKGGDGKMAPAPRGKAPEFHCRFDIGPPPLFMPITFGTLLFSAILLNMSSDTLVDLVQLWTQRKVESPTPAIYVTLSLWAKGLGGIFVAFTSIYALRKMPVGK